MLLGGALQLTNMYGDTFLDDFKKVPAYGPILCGKILYYHHVHLADFGNAVYSDHSIFP